MPRDFVVYILPFGLVRLRTFHLVHGLVRCNINAGVHAHVSFRDVKIKIPDRNWGDITHWKCGLRFKKKQLVEFPPQKKKVDFQNWARLDDFMRCGRRMLVGLRADNVKEVSIERLCLSLLMSNKL